MVGAIQTVNQHAADIAALIVKLTSDGALVFDKQFNGRANETGDGVAVAPDNTIYVTGTTTTFGAGNQDAFVLHLQPTRKKILDALTWGGAGFETGAGVAVNGGTLMLAATTTTAPQYSLLAASAKLLAARGAPLRSSRACSPMSPASWRILLRARQSRKEARRSAEISRRRS
jgi:hypothetical protein